MLFGGSMRVEVAFTATAAMRAEDGSPWFTWDDPVYGVWDSVGEWAGTVWTDISEYVWGGSPLSATRGRSRELDQFQAGRASFVLTDRDRLFDPSNTSSLYAGQIVPMRRIRITAVAGSYETVAFSGYVTEWERWWENGGLPRVNVTCVDGFRVLAGCEVDEVTLQGEGETSGARIVRVLDRSEVDFGAGRDIDDGASLVAGTTLGRNALELVQEAAVAENGTLFVARDGTLTFRGRHARMSARPVVTIVCGPETADTGSLSPSESLFPSETLDPGGGVPGIRFHGVTQNYSDDLLFNRAVVSGDSGNVQVAEDAGSMATYLTRTLERTGTILASDDEAANAAVWLVDRYSQPEIRLTSATVKLHDPALSDVNRRDILSLDVGDPVAVYWSPEAGVLLEQASIVDGVTHYRSRDGWTATLQLSQADTVVYMRWDDEQSGVWSQDRWTY